jgi:hypothetical protein
VLAPLVLSAQFILSGVRSVGLPWPITHPEGATIAAMLRVRDGEALYQPFLQYPYLITPYPPVQPVAVGLISRLLGLSVLEMAGLARSLTLAASLLTTVLIWLIARRLGAGRLAALAGAGLFLPLPFLDEWGFAARPDVPAIALSLLAMLALVWRPDRAWLAAVVVVLALFTKQTAVALPVAATVWLMLSGRWRGALLFCLVLAALTAGTVGLLELATGRTYILNTVLAHLNTPKNGFDLAARDILPLFQDGWLPVGLAVLAFLVPSVRQRAGLPLLYVGVSTGLALYSLRNTGGDVNYLIEPAAAACIPAALAIDWLWRTWGIQDQRPRKKALTPRPPLLCEGEGEKGSAGTMHSAPTDRSAVKVGAQFIAPSHGALLPLAVSVILAAATVVWAAGLWEFWRLDGGVDPTGRLPLAEIAAADAVLSEEPLAVLLAGHPLVVSDTFHLSMLTTSGFFDPTELERRIKRGEFDLIVMRSDVSAPRRWKRQLLLPEPVRLAIKDTYRPAGRVGMFWLYKPEDRRASER